jgi:hypothetical protein
MDSASHAAHPGFWERLAFLIVRLSRMQQVGASATYGMENAPSLPLGRPLTEAEIDESELIRLSSAVWHLQYGEMTSRWSDDSYLDRLVRAKPALRLKALEEHGLTLDDYERWLSELGDTVPPAIH